MVVHFVQYKYNTINEICVKQVARVITYYNPQPISCGGIINIADTGCGM